MKKFLAVLTVFTSMVQADPFHAELNLLSYFLGRTSLNLNYKITEKFTVGVYGSYFNPKTLGIDWSGVGFGARSDFYPFATPYTNAWYLALGLGYRMINGSSGPVGTLSASGFEGQLTTGYLWFFNKISIRLGGGAGVNNYPARVVSSLGSTIVIPENGFYFALEGAIGYVF